MLFAQSGNERFDELFQKGDELYYAYKYEEAIPVFRQAFEVAIQENLPFEHAHYSLYSISLSYLYSFKYQKAIEHVNYSLDTYRSRMSDLHIGENYFLLGSINIDFDRFQDAIVAYDQSMHFFQKINNSKRLTRAYTARGIAYIELDKYELALKDLQKAEEIVPEDGDSEKSFLYMTFFSLYDYMGKSSLGVPYLEKAYNLAKKTGKKIDQLNTSIYLANNLILENQYSEGLRYANEALTIAKEINELPQLSTIYDVIGRIYYGLAEYEQSVLHYNEAIDIYRSLNLPKKAAELEITIARIALRQGDLEAAEFILSEVNSNVLSDRYKVTLLIKQAEVQIVKNNFDKANKYLDDALALIDEDLSIMKSPIYDLYLKFPDEMIPHSKKLEYGRLIYESSSAKSRGNIMSSELKLARLFEPINTDSAFYYAYRTLDKLEDRRVSTHSNTLKTSLNAKWQHFYYTLASWEAKHKNDYSAAFNLFERAKSRALFDQIYERRFFSLFDSENPSSIQLLELQKKIDRLYQQEADETIIIENNHALEIAELELQYQTLQDELIKANPAMQDIEYPEVTSLNQAQDLLDNKSAIISYGITSNQLYLFVILNNDFHFIPIQQSSEFRELLTNDIEAFRSAIISQTDKELLAEASVKLTKQLIDPIADLLEGIKHLIVIPDGPLHLLPFEALIMDEQYLIEKFAIKYIPSVSVLNIIRELPPIDYERSLLGVASSGFESGDELAVARSQNAFSTLPYTLAEVDSIQSRFPDAKIIKNEDVTEAAFKNLSLSDYRFLHFATHGNINETVPDQSGLILSKKTETEVLFGEDGYLNAREISQLNLTANLVVLSACNTGIGRIINGEGVMGLQRSFLVAGASSVIVSLWSIYDRSTPVFMDLFYKNLKEIEEDETSFFDRALMYANLYNSDIVDFKTLALQQTKKQMIEHPYYNHPVHWAPFVLNGK